MISLPYNKWTLVFTNPEHECLYEEQSNKIKAFSFRILNLLMAFSGLVCLIIFLVQGQPYYLVIVISGVVGGCFTFFLLSYKLQPYMRIVFSLMYIWSVFTNAIISFSGIEIPNYVFGFGTGCLAMGLLQNSDNRVKLIYLLTTPIVLLGIFDVYKINTLQFVFQLFSCIAFIATIVYMNEYTSRLAFSLNIIANKQKDIINEFVNDSMFAISLNQRTRQFVLEFQNKQFEEQIGIKETEQLKVFLRSSYCIQKQTESVKKQSEFSTKKKQQTLEELLYLKMSQLDCFSNCVEVLPDFCYLDPNTEQVQTMQISLKIIDYGKPVLIILIRSNQVPQLIKEYEEKIKYYQKSILNQSNQIAAKQINVLKETKKILIDSLNQPKLLFLSCLQLQALNSIRNYQIFFQKERINQSVKCLDIYKLNDYLKTLEEYFLLISLNSKRRFQLMNIVDINLTIRLNINYLTQAVINIFDQVLLYSKKQELITLSISEEFSLNPLQARNNTVGYESFKKVEQSMQGVDQKVIQFCFCFHSEISNFQINNLIKDQNSNTQEVTEKTIVQSVTFLLLDMLGPYNSTYSIQSTIEEVGGQFLNKLQFYIYTDQSLLELSYAKQTNSQQQKYSYF